MNWSRCLRWMHGQGRLGSDDQPMPNGKGWLRLLKHYQEPKEPNILENRLRCFAGFVRVSSRLTWSTERPHPDPCGRGGECRAVDHKGDLPLSHVWFFAIGYFTSGLFLSVTMKWRTTQIFALQDYLVTSVPLLVNQKSNCRTFN